MQILHEVPSSVIDLKQKAALGQRFIDAKTGYLYRYAKNGGTAAAVATQIACFHTTAAKGVLTMTAGTSLVGTLGTVAGEFAGIWMAAIPANYFGLVLCEGETIDKDGTLLLKTDGGVVAGDPLVVDGAGTPTFIADTAVAGQEHAVFGFARADDVSTLVHACVKARW